MTRIEELELENANLKTTVRILGFNRVEELEAELARVQRADAAIAKQLSRSMALNAKLKIALQAIAKTRSVDVIQAIANEALNEDTSV